MYSVGKYKVENDNTIVITDLPYRVWTESYYKSIRDKDLVKDIKNISGKDEV